MHCRSSADLPPPPAGKTGWPWTGEMRPLSQVRGDGSPWPLISIVTPTRNQAQFIEETIRSVLLQGYPHLEYVVIDGASTDDTIGIIRKYERWLARWVSEKDRGQTDAINKGLQYCRGQIFNWLNSDDVLLPGALANIAQAYSGNAVAAPILMGNEISNATKRENRRLSSRGLLRNDFFPQPGLWIPLDKFRTVGLDDTLNYAFDWAFGLKYLSRFRQVDYIDSPVVFFRTHASSKSVRDRELFRKEGLLILSRLARAATAANKKSAYRKALHRAIWERHLIQWTSGSGRRRDTATRMALLAFRRPGWRVSRFWLGALRRVLIAPSRGKQTIAHTAQKPRA